LNIENADEVRTEVRLNDEQQEDRKNEKKVYGIVLFLLTISDFHCVENSYCDHPCHVASLLDGYRHFTGTHYLHLLDNFETLVPT
jgi:hypothetical protein